MASRSIWIDITELFDQFRHASHPTGMSRTVMKLADALAAEPGNVFRAARPLFFHPILRRAITTENALLAARRLLPAIETLYIRAGLAGTSYSSRAMKAIATSLPNRCATDCFRGITALSCSLAGRSNKELSSRLRASTTVIAYSCPGIILAWQLCACSACTSARGANPDNGFRSRHAAAIASRMAARPAFQPVSPWLRNISPLL